MDSWVDQEKMQPDRMTPATLQFKPWLLILGYVCTFNTMATSGQRPFRLVHPILRQSLQPANPETERATRFCCNQGSQWRQTKEVSHGSLFSQQIPHALHMHNRQLVPVATATQSPASIPQIRGLSRRCSSAPGTFWRSRTCFGGP